MPLLMNIYGHLAFACYVAVCLHSTITNDIVYAKSLSTYKSILWHFIWCATVYFGQIFCSPCVGFVCICVEMRWLCSPRIGSFSFWLLPFVQFYWEFAWTNRIYAIQVLVRVMVFYIFHITERMTQTRGRRKRKVIWKMANLFMVFLRSVWCLWEKRNEIVRLPIYFDRI